MTNDLALPQMRQHHAAILAILSHGERLLDLTRPDPAHAHALGCARWELARALIAYQAFKHVWLFEPLARGTPDQARGAAELRHECDAMGEAYRDYCRRWAIEGVAADWNAYQRHAQTMVIRLRAHLTRERARVEALVAASAPSAPEPSPFWTVRPRPPSAPAPSATR